MPSATSDQGLVHIAPEKELSDYSVDIVAVPGLGADPKGSFISEKTKFDWLKDEKDGILSDIKTARVLKYQYDSRWLGDKALKQTLNNVAELFLDGLVEKRKDHDTRPIIFLAHSMGGLVVAKALTLAVSHPEKIDRMRIYECFAGGIFFGTPFGGSNQVARGIMLASFLSTFKEGIPSQMMQVLDPERDSLIELRRDFAELVQKEPRARIACFFEQRDTNYSKVLGDRVPKLMRPSGLVVTEASATLDGADIRGMACDHRDLNRFDGGKDGRFAIVKYHLGNIERDARQIVRKRLNISKRSVVDDATFSRLADSLNIVQFQRKRKSLESASGNSEWILKEPKFLHWLSWNNQQGDSTFLWVSGSEGLGKSKAALAAVEKLENVEKERRRDESEVMVAYFFCDSTTDTQSAENLLKSLIWQLILKRRSLAQYVRGFAAPESARSISAQSSISLSKLWSGLQDMLRDESAPSVYFVLNNMHYLENDEVTAEFWGKIQELINDSGGIEDPIQKNVKWIFLSRARDNIRSVLEERHDGKALRINLEDGSKDKELRHMLKAFTRDRVRSLSLIKGYSLALQYFVTSVLLKRAENNKLWVDVVCCLLEALPSNHVQVRKTLEALPQSVEELMNRVWAESLKSNAESIYTTKEILRTLAIVYEYPTLNELKVLAELDEASDADHIRDQIRACGPLLRIYDDDYSGGDLGSFRVTFIHEAAKEALLREKSSRKLIGLSDLDDGAEHTEVQLQHGILALRCFSYTIREMGQDDDDNINFVQTEEKDDKEDEDAPELKGLFPDVGDEDEDEEEESDEFYGSLEYPVKYWLRHGYEATPDFVDTLDLKNAFWASESLARRRWWNTYARGDDEVNEELKNLTSMHIAAYFGLTPLIDSLLIQNHGNEIFVRDSWDNQPLHWAAAKGHIEAMEKLIYNRADINDGQQDQVWTPLHMAASEGRLEAMKLLLSGRYGEANINAVAKDDGTALTLALASNQEKAAKLLLDYGANPTLTAEGGESPMATAAYNGQEELIGMLLAKGGAHSLVSQNFGSAVAAAASAGQISIVKKLLPYSDIISRQRALEEAAKSGFHFIVRLLLQTTQQLKCDTAFETAALMGHDLVVEELWNHNGRLNWAAISPNSINNALYNAAEDEKESTVLFLLQQCRANPNATGSMFGNAMTAAAYDGNIPILKSLLQFGADVNAASGYPLQAAASQGNIEAIKLLLDHNAFVDSNSSLFVDGTALQAACVARQIEVINELLRRGANPNLGSGPLTNPITAAATNVLGDVVVSLLQKGANPNVFGGADGSAPLINAACNLSSKYLEAMIKYGASVDIVDPDGDTALIMSAYYQDIDCVRVLLDHGANVNFCGKHHGTALHTAAAEGYAEICRLLLERGADPTIRGGPYDTVVQAAAYSGEVECMKALFNDQGVHPQRSWKNKIDVNLQGGECFTALHAAVVNSEDGCVRLLLERKPNLNIVPRANPSAGTALYAAAFAGCNRNARLLLEAGANPNIGGGKRGTVLQVAALKGNDDLCKLLIEHGAKVDDWSGKYGSALVAAVVKDYHFEEADALEYLLTQDFTPQAYRAALEKAFNLQRKDAFKLIWLSIKSKGPKKLKLSTKQLLTYFQARAKKRNNQAKKLEDENSDFGSDVDYYGQDYDSEEVDENDDDDDDDKKADAELTKNLQANAATPGTTTRNIPDRSRGIDGNTASGTTRGVDDDDNNQPRNLGRGDDDDDGNAGYAGQRGIGGGDDGYAGQRGIGGDDDDGNAGYSGQRGIGGGDDDDGNAGYSGYSGQRNIGGGAGYGDEGENPDYQGGDEGGDDNETQTRGFGGHNGGYGDQDNENEPQGYEQNQEADGDDGYAGNQGNQYQAQNYSAYPGTQDNEDDGTGYAANRNVAYDGNEGDADETQGYSAYNPNQGDADATPGYSAYNPNQGGYQAQGGYEGYDENENNQYGAPGYGGQGYGQSRGYGGGGY